MATTSPGTGTDPGARKLAIERLVNGVRDDGRPVVPLVGAGISVEAGVPPLSEVTRYLAKTKAYLRYRVFENTPHSNSLRDRSLAGILRGENPPPFRLQPRDFLREFGWPDPHELNSSLWHWMWHWMRASSSERSKFSESMDLLVNSEILESLGRLDGDFAESVRKQIRDYPDDWQRWMLRGSYWKILLTQLTRSSPDLVDTLFQRLTRNREPAIAHRYFALLTPVLRMRLFLTINFDDLLEESLRIEGLRPTIYEVADGLSLPHPKLIQEGLSVVKLHGGAYGLLVGDKLDSPLDEETRARFQEYLPEHLILLVMGMGGWDQRVLDMVELAHQRQGEVWWLHFEPDPPALLKDRFQRGDVWPTWLNRARVQDPGAFLREVYFEYKRSHPSSSRPFQVCDLRPVLHKVVEEGDAGGVYWSRGERLVIFEDDPRDHGLGASLRLARFVAEKSKTHLPLWMDLETKHTVEDVLVELIQQLRRYDPGLPPEILAMERSTSAARDAAGQLDFRKVVRRLYSALARGRYILALNGIRSFGRRPTRHHAYEEAGEDSREQFQAMREFLRRLIDAIEPDATGWPESLGLLDSILAFSLDHPEAEGPKVQDILISDKVERVPDSSEALKKYRGEPRRERPDLPFFHGDAGRSWTKELALVLLSAIRRRRSVVALHLLMPKYLRLQRIEQPWREIVAGYVEKGCLWQVEGGDYWMSRKLRNAIYRQIRKIGASEHPGERVPALAALAFIHQDLAEYHHRDVYVGSQDVSSLLEEFYHRIASLRLLHLLENEAEVPIGKDLHAWLQELAQPDSKLKREAMATLDGANRASSLVDAAGRLDRGALISRRFRNLRALREVLAQEREALLSNVPSVTLQSWVSAVRLDLQEIAAEPAVGGVGWSRAIKAERDRLEDLLEQIEGELLKDRMKSQEILSAGGAWLRQKIAAVDGEPDTPMDSREEGLRWLLGADSARIRPTFEEVDLLCRGDDQAEPDPDLWRRRERVVLLLAGLAQALKRSTWSPSRKQGAAHFESLIERLLDSWCAPEEPVSTELLALKVLHLRLVADQELWGKSPWDTKGKGWNSKRKQEESAKEALRCSEGALQILDSIHEEDRTLRSHVYSIKGRALYLMSDFGGAYREFDLARAGLSEATAAEREVLAVTLLRQAECLMVHSDDALASWVLDLIEKKAFDETKPWARLLSSEGLRKHRLQPIDSGGVGANADDHARLLMSLSLANCSPEALDVVEGVARSIEPHRRALDDTLGAMRSRLAAARDLLDRAERLLEFSRSKVEWWACFFQLRTQLSVERLLLLLSGDLSAVSTVREPQGRQFAVSTAWDSSTPWSPVRRWLLVREPLSQDGRLPQGWERDPRRPQDRLIDDGDLRRRFIHRFQGLLRHGVMAVRQGLDVLLPNDASRKEEGRLEFDTLLNRLLRSWTELMVCGAYATEMSQRVRPEHAFDDNLRERFQQTESPGRWQQWAYLNWLSGLVTLPKCPELEEWFRVRDWNTGPPSLASRASTLARMDLCLGRPDSRSDLQFHGGEAIRHLHGALKRDAG